MVFVGYVIETMAVAQLLSSLIFSKIMNTYKLERYKMVVFGLILVILGEFGFGSLEWVNDTD